MPNRIRHPHHTIVIAALGVALAIGLAGCGVTSTGLPAKAPTGTAPTGKQSAAVAQRTIPQPPAARRLTPCARWSIEVSVDYQRATPLADCQGGLVVGVAKTLTVHVGQRVYFGDGKGEALSVGVSSDSPGVGTAQTSGSSVLAVGVGVTDVRATSGIECVRNGSHESARSCVLVRLSVKA